jgi:hypothetical protein
MKHLQNVPLTVSMENPGGDVVIVPVGVGRLVDVLEELDVVDGVLQEGKPEQSEK